MLLIAELCQNHNGDINVLERMVRSAADNGATHVKVQNIFAEDLVYRAEYENDPKTPLYMRRPFGDEFKRLKSLELTLDDQKRFIDMCVSHSVIPFTTVFSRNSLENAVSFSWPQSIVKIASYDCSSIPLILQASEYFDDLIISTGATYDAEVAYTAKELSSKNIDFAFLHCVTSYPQQIKDAHLLRMSWLKQFTSRVGFSDHSPRSNPLMLSMCAIYLGAQYIERHFTILDDGETKDGPVSIRPEELRKLSEFSMLSSAGQLAELQSRFGDSNLAEVFTYQSGMSSFSEVRNREYYRGRFASVVDDSKTVLNNWL